MTITVRLFATLREGRGKELELEANNEATPRDLAARLGIDVKDVAILLVNGRDGRLDDALADGDRVSVFPPVGGG
ncbi:MAG: molybdopterin synthase sulfur carrier subunit [Treponema sp. GWB1_62_6]|nr:MAG: molybdopterin synthase sulfur carrier subunit [Treponema sp. GWC1_61_84]OHE65998.1 MAG: molybdopterin synthase sulfur carrier subunit [Treponema sp. GWB1_62_6]HCM25918.1 molybdopterin synthase sulfur carrier subunit [Treponema sp.]